MRGYCYGSGGTCWGSYIEGQQYGVNAQADNGSGISIGVYGVSYGVGGQGVAGSNAQANGFGGVFTATGASWYRYPGDSTSGFGGYITSTTGTGLERLTVKAATGVHLDRD